MVLFNAWYYGATEWMRVTNRSGLVLNILTDRFTMLIKRIGDIALVERRRNGYEHGGFGKIDSRTGPIWYFKNYNMRANNRISSLTVSRNQKRMQGRPRLFCHSGSGSVQILGDSETQLGRAEST
jgi:hypothetical protein